MHQLNAPTGKAIQFLEPTGPSQVLNVHLARLDLSPGTRLNSQTLSSCLETYGQFVLGHPGLGWITAKLVALIHRKLAKINHSNLHIKTIIGACLGTMVCRMGRATYLAQSGG